MQALVRRPIDGDAALPPYCGTGPEDYVGSAWGMGQHAAPYGGVPIVVGGHTPLAAKRAALDVREKKAEGTAKCECTKGGKGCTCPKGECKCANCGAAKVAW